MRLCQYFFVLIAPLAGCFTLIFGYHIASTASGLEYKVTILHPMLDNYGTEALGGTGGIQVGSMRVNNGLRALLWNGTPESEIDLTPPAYDFSSATAAYGNKQVGYGGYYPTGNVYRAFLWYGSAASAVNLHPNDYYDSQAFGISGDSQVGLGHLTNSPISHALLWHGSAASVNDLNPIGITSSRALGVSGDKQVGVGDGHAFLWSGSAASAVDLHPAGYLSSDAFGVSGESEVGSARFAGSTDFRHAMLWKGNAASAVDLHPSWFYDSVATGVLGNLQIGFGQYFQNFFPHALLWNGTAESVIDLNQFLPPTVAGAEAFGISSDGTIVGRARDGNLNYYAIMWTPVPAIPEPSAAILLSGGVFAMGLWLRRNRSYR